MDRQRRMRPADRTTRVDAASTRRPDHPLESLMGNQAMVDAMGTAPGSGRSRAFAGLGEGTTLGQAEKEEQEIRPAFATGRWADTLQGGRFNAGSGDPTLGGLVDPEMNFAGGGTDHASDETDTTTTTTTPSTSSDSSSTTIKMTNGDNAGTATGVSGGSVMGAVRTPAVPFTVVSGGGKHIVLAGRPREDDAGGAAQGPTPLDVGKGPGRVLTSPGKAGGPDDGRGDVGGGGAGPSGQDDKLIQQRSGGATDAERADDDRFAQISMETALAQSFHTDPTRGRAT